MDKKQKERSVNPAETIENDAKEAKKYFQEQLAKVRKALKTLKKGFDNAELLEKHGNARATREAWSYALGCTVFTSLEDIYEILDALTEGMYRYTEEIHKETFTFRREVKKIRKELKKQEPIVKRIEQAFESTDKVFEENR